MAAPDTLKLKPQHSAPTTSTSTPTTTTTKTLENFMERMGEYKQQAQERMGEYKQQAQQQAQGSVMSVRNWLVQAINNTSDTLRHYINRYPPLAAFLFTLIVLSAVPVACFTIFTFVTSAIFLTVALVGFGFVEGLCLMAGGGVLLAVLGGIALVTTIGFAWVSLVYVAWRGGSFMAQRLMESGQQLGQKTQEAIHQMQQQSGTTGYQSQQPSSGIFSTSSTSQPQM